MRWPWNMTFIFPFKNKLYDKNLKWHNVGTETSQDQPKFNLLVYPQLLIQSDKFTPSFTCPNTEHRRMRFGETIWLANSSHNWFFQLVGYLVGYMVGYMVCYVALYLVIYMDSSLVGYLFVSLVGSVVGCVVGSMVGYLVASMVVWLFILMVDLMVGDLIGYVVGYLIICSVSD